MNKIPKIGSLVRHNGNWPESYQGVKEGETAIVTGHTFDSEGEIDGFLVNNWTDDDGGCSPEYWDLVAKPSELGNTLFLNKENLN